MTRTVALMLLILGLPASTFAQPQPPARAEATPAPAYKLSGLVFGDYYAFPAHHLDTWKNQQGFWLRRAYLTYDGTFTPALSARLRLEMNGNGRLEGGALAPYLKDAWLRWAFAERHALTIGMQPTPTFDYVEEVWGLRHIEKTPLDLYRWDSSRDTALSMGGVLGAGESVRYAVQFGNESGSNAERDRHKGYRASLQYETANGFSIEGVFGHFDRPRDADRMIAQLFGAYRAGRGRAGLQYAFQRRRAAAQTESRDLRLVSAFAVLDLRPKKSSVFLRLDRQPDACVDCAAVEYLPINLSTPFTMTLAGLEHAIGASVRFSPNFEWIVYDEPPAPVPAGPKADLVLRLTFYWSF